MQAYHQPLEYFVWEISYANLSMLQADNIDFIHKDKDGKLPGSGTLKDMISSLQKSQEAKEKEEEANKIIQEALARKRAKKEQERLEQESKKDENQVAESQGGAVNKDN